MREADRRMTDASERLKFATDYAQGGLRGLFLANGAAIVSLMTLLGNAKDVRIDPVGIWWAFACFSLGLAVILLTYILGYLAQSSYMQASLHISLQAESDAHGTGHFFDYLKHERRGSRAEYAGIFFASTSLIAFVCGAFVALNAIT